MKSKKMLSIILVLILAINSASCARENPMLSGTDGFDVSDLNSDGSQSDLQSSDGNLSNNSNSGTALSSNAALSGASTPSSVSKVSGVSNDKPIEQGLDFGGQTFTKTIIGPISSEVLRRKAAFEKKFNCKITIVKLQWETYNSSVATSVLSGKPYDICGLHNYFFPEAVVQDLYEPLDSYISDADKYNKSAPNKGGIDMQNSSFFNYKGKMYGVNAHRGPYATYPYLLFYNKKMMSEAGYSGAKDPQAMYKANKWKWSDFEAMAKALYSPSTGKYILGQDFNPAVFSYTNAGFPVKSIGGLIKENLTDPKMFKAFQTIQKWYSPNKTYFENTSATDESDNPEKFYNGSHYMFMQASFYGPLIMMQTIEKSPAFDKKISNLGVVPIPTGPDNTTKAVICSGLNAKAAGKGSKDPRIVIAWTKYYDSFVDPMAKTDPYLWDSNTLSFINSLYDNLIIPAANYKTNDFHGDWIVAGIANVAKTQGDISARINDSRSKYQGIIDQALKQ